MSKNLEAEYKKMLADDLPDLWARIESALPDNVSADNVKEPELQQYTPESTETEQVRLNSQTVVSIGEKQSSKKKKNYNRLLKYSGFIAAGLFVSVIAGVLWTLPSEHTADAERNDAIMEQERSPMGESAAEQECSPMEDGAAGTYDDACDAATDVNESASFGEVYEESAGMERPSAENEAAMEENEEGISQDVEVSNVMLTICVGESVVMEGYACYEVMIVSDAEAFYNGEIIYISEEHSMQSIGKKAWQALLTGEEYSVILDTAYETDTMVLYYITEVVVDSGK